MLELKNKEPLAVVNTSLGELCVFQITVGGQLELAKELAKPLKSCDPNYFARKLFRQVCFLKVSLRDGKYKPDKPTLSDSDIESLSVDDIETVAKAYVDNSPYLTRKLLTKTTPHKDKGTVISIEYGDIEHHKLEEETYTQYLFRLSLKEQEKQAKQLSDVMSGFKAFSDPLGKSIRDTLNAGDTLSRMMDSIRSPYIRPIEPVLPNIDWAKIERRNEERRLKPFNELSDRMDKLIDSTTETTKFLIKANELQTQIAAEIKNTGDDAKRWAKINTIIGVIVIALTVSGVCVSSYFYWSGRNDSVAQSAKTEEYVNRLDNRLIDINRNITSPKDNNPKGRVNRRSKTIR
jgi:hypothetical protein